MSKHNYSQYSDKKKTNPNQTARPADMQTAKIPLVPDVKMELEVVEETVDTVSLPKTVTGVVVNCAKLNVRKEPSAYADVVCVLDVMSEIVIDAAESDNEWFKIYTAAGVEGYCMRKFVDAHL